MLAGSLRSEDVLDSASELLKISNLQLKITQPGDCIDCSDRRGICTEGTGQIHTAGASYSQGGEQHIGPWDISAVLPVEDL
jgi:sulfur relay (sulfurtransferase) complex TusBCD TusD component (DsrE family)